MRVGGGNTAPPRRARRRQVPLWHHVSTTAACHQGRWPNLMHRLPPHPWCLWLGEGPWATLPPLLRIQSFSSAPTETSSPRSVSHHRQCSSAHVEGSRHVLLTISMAWHKGHNSCTVFLSPSLVCAARRGALGSWATLAPLFVEIFFPYRVYHMHVVSQYFTQNPNFERVNNHPIPHC
jgi:hypothetical protein